VKHLKIYIVIGVFQGLLSDVDVFVDEQVAKNREKALKELYKNAGDTTEKNVQTIEKEVNK